MTAPPPDDRDLAGGREAALPGGLRPACWVAELPPDSSGHPGGVVVTAPPPSDRVFVRPFGPGAAEPGGTVKFWCPGCDRRHAITTGPSGWTWNGDREHPTFTPSVLVHPHETFIDPDLEGDALVADANRTTTPRCHSFVTDGRIEFLTDSTHAMSGQTVDLPVWRPTDA